MMTTESIRERLTALEAILKRQEDDRQSLIEVERRIALLTEAQTTGRHIADIQRDIAIATRKRDLSQRKAILDQQCITTESDLSVSEEASRELLQSLADALRESEAAEEHYTERYAIATAARDTSRCATRVKELVTDYLPRISDAENRLHTAEAFMLLTDSKKGVGPLLLEECRQALVEEMNASLWEAEASFTVSIDATFAMSLIDNVTRVSVPSTSASGYQAFILGIVSSKALVRLSRAPVPNLFMIDEGFGALDDANLPLTGDLVTRLPSLLGNGMTVIAVTHRDDMKTLFRNHLTISRKARDGVSKVEWMNTGTPQYLQESAASRTQPSAATTSVGIGPRKDNSPPPSITSATSRAKGSSTARRVNPTSPREWEITAMEQGMLHDYTCERCGGGSCFPSQTVWKRHASSQKHARNGG